MILINSKALGGIRKLTRLIIWLPVFCKHSGKSLMNFVKRKMKTKAISPPQTSPSVVMTVKFVQKYVVMACFGMKQRMKRN